MFKYKAHEEDIVTNQQISTIKDFKFVLSWHIFSAFDDEINKRKNLKNILVEFVVNSNKYIIDFYIPNDKKLPILAMYSDNYDEENRAIDYKMVSKYVKHNGKDDDKIPFKGYDMNDFDDDADDTSSAILYSKTTNLKIVNFRIEYRREEAKNFDLDTAQLVLVVNFETV